jgi:RHS repeat-associated protein
MRFSPMRRLFRSFRRSVKEPTPARKRLRRSPWLLLEQLEDRTLLSTWVNPAGGDWDTPGNWSPAAVPGPSDDVTINANPGAVITHSSNIADTIKSLTASNPISLSQGSLSVAGALADTSNFTISGGATLANATVSAGTTILAIGGGGTTLSNLTLNGVLDLTTYGNPPTNSVTVANGMTLNGEIRLGSTDGSVYSTLGFSGTEALSGSGDILLGGSSFNSIAISSNATVTFGPNLTLHGKNGTIGTPAGQGGGAFINQGTIQPDVAGGSFNLDGTNWQNQSKIEVDANETVTLRDSWSNTGQLVVNGGTLNLAGSFTTAGSGIFAPAPAANFSRTGGTVNLSGTLDNTNGTMSLDSRTGPWNFSSAIYQGTITNGIVNTDGTNNLVVLNGGGTTLSNVTMNGVLDMTSTFNSALTVTDGMTLNGQIRLGSADGNNPGYLAFSGKQTLSGTGDILFGASGANSISVPGNTTVTFGPNVTLHGKIGTIGTPAGQSGGAFINQGTIQPDVSGGSFSLDGTNWQNQGKIEVDTNKTVTLRDSWSNTGQLVVNGGTLNLSGSFTTAGSGIFAPAPAGNFSRTGGTVTVSGVLDNTNSTISLDSRTGPWNFSSAINQGFITNGIVNTDGTNNLVVLNGSGNTLSNVTMNGVLDMTATFNTALTVTNGMTLNGEIRLGSADGVNPGFLSFSGAQLVSGSGDILFGPSGSNSISIPGNSTVTFGPKVTLHGKNGTIGTPAGQGGGAFINQGTIDPDVAGGSFMLDGTNWQNQGTIKADANETVNLRGSWSNTGNIALTGGTLNLGGTFKTADVAIGHLSRSAGTTNLSGTLNNAAATLFLDTHTGPWNLITGTIDGGTITTVGSNDLVCGSNGGGGYLNGVTVNGTLDVANNVSGVGAAGVNVTNGLTLNGSMLVGSPDGSIYGQVYFQGNQTLTGSGSILFGNSAFNSLNVSSNALLTIDTPTTVHGASGTISGAIANLGTIAADGGRTLTVQNLTSNQGILRSLAGSTLVLQSSVTVNGSAILAGLPGATLSVRGDLLGATTNADLFSAQGTTRFEGSGTSSSPQQLEAMSSDLGNVSSAFSKNFAYGTLALGNNTRVKLVDNNHNSAGIGAEAVYTDTLVVPSGTTLDLNGLHLYARSMQVQGTVLNGSVSQVPDQGALLFATPTPGSIALGATEDWTFFGRAGQAVTAIVTTGSGGTYAPLTPYLSFGQVKLVDSKGNTLATAGNTQSGGDAVLQQVALPADGTYHLKVQAPPGQSSNTGDYGVALFDATVTTAQVNLNQTAFGQLPSPYALNRWTFAAQANDQIQFNPVSTAGAGFVFDLAGPNNYTGFTGLSVSSGPLTLPSSGTYTLTARSTHGAQGSYAFAVTTTTLTTLVPGTAYNGVFAAGGQAQYFKVTVPQAEQLPVTLQDTSSADRNEVYLKFGAEPTRADFQYEAITTGANQQLVVPMAAPGDWYILVYSEFIASPPSPFTLTTASSPVVLNGVTPTVLGNGADGVVTLAGAGFDSTTNVSLVAAGGATYAASQVQLDLPTQLSATFAAGAVPAGTYSVVVTRGDGTSASLTNAFTMHAGGKPNVHFNLVTGSSLGYHTASTLYLQYSNTGDLATPAPVVEVTVSQTHANGTTDQKALLTLDPSLANQGLWTSTVPAGFSNSITLLASGSTPGLLQPGDSVQVPIYWGGWQQPWDIPAYPNFDPEVGVEASDDTTAIPWTALQAGFQPADISTPAWNALFPGLEAQIGSTWGDFVKRMDSDAAYLGHLGEKVTDLNQLWRFEVQQANGISPLGTLHVDIDAGVPTVGPVLAVHRAWPNSIQARNQMGPFGYGWQWADGWQRQLTVSGGTVTIADADGSLRLFQRDTRTGGYFSEPGDHGTLTAISGGGYTLQESNGAITSFGTDGKVAFIADSNGNKISAVYSKGLLTSLVASSGQSLAFAYNSAGLITSITDSFGRVSTFTYDPTNQYLVAANPFDGDDDTYTYDTTGGPATRNALVSVHHDDGPTDYFLYDAQGRLTQTNRNGNTDVLSFTFGAGKVTATDATGAAASSFFDATGLVVKQTDPLGNATHFAFDENDRLVKVIDAAGQVTSKSYDANGNIISNTDPNGATVTYTFAGPLNKMTSFTDANGNKLTYGYDSHGNLLSNTYADQSQEQYSYNVLGELAGLTNRRGQATGFTYNAAGAITRETFADGTHLDYAYDSHGNLISAADASGTTTFQYDLLTDDLIQVNYPGGRFLTFTYDASERRTQCVDQSGFTIHYLYNNNGLLAGLTDGSGNSIVTYTYDANDRLNRKDLANGTYTTYAYDLAGDLLHLVNHDPSGSVSSRFDYTYDSLHRRTTMSTLDGNWSYQYDPDGQLVHAVFQSTNSAVPNQDLSYVYDPAGNRVQTTINGTTTQYVTNNLNQYIQVGSTRYAYDLDGNLISTSDASGTTSYTYDQLNRLIAVASPTDVATYRYDPLDEPASVTDNGQTTQYQIDPVKAPTIWGTYSGSGSVQAHYEKGLSLTSRVDSKGQVSYYDFDGIGSTVGLSNAAGTYQNTYSYLPFGEIASSSGTIPNPFLFVGQLGVGTQGSGLDLMSARYYSAADGRFVTPDPTNLRGGHNFYAYGKNSPLDMVDPKGLDVDYCVGASASAMPFGVSAGCGCGVSAGWGIGIGIGPGMNGPGIGGAGCGCSITVGPQASLGVGAGASAGPSAGGCVPIFPPGPPPDDDYSCPPPKHRDSMGCHDGPPPPPPAPPPPAPPCDPTVSSCSPPPKSMDPNAKTGPVGYGPQAFISINSALSYRVDFENDPTATAPAQRVVITDPLDPNIDWSTIQFTEVGFSDTLITVPAGSQHFQTTVSKTYGGLTFNVQIELSFNPQTGLLTATFQSIDPNDNLPPPILVGFLPPEDGTGRGLGHVSYKGLLKAGLPTGTQVRNVATVTFDINPPITTDQVSETDPNQGVDLGKQCLNTVDAVAPTSSVSGLSAYSPSSFKVSWSGKDDPGGAGIDGYVVYVSDNGGPFTLWQSETIATSATYTGLDGHSYGFYSVAEDNAGNVQPIPALAQTTTKVDATPPNSAVTALPPSSPGSFTVSWSGADNAGGSGLASFSIYVSDNNGPFTLWQGPTTQTSATFTGTPGHTYGFYSVATDNVGNVEATPSAAEATTFVLIPTTTTVVSDHPSGSTYGQTVVFTATVTASPSFTSSPGDSVQFQIDGNNVGNPMTLSGASASFSTATLDAGTHTITATFSGDSTYSGSPGSTSITVGQATPTIVVNLVNVPYDGLPHGTTAEVYGVGTADLGPATIAYSSGTTPVIAGVYDVTASFAGNTDYAPVTITATGAITITPPANNGNSNQFVLAIDDPNAPGSEVVIADGAPAGTTVIGPGGVSMTTTAASQVNIPGMIMYTQPVGAFSFQMTFAMSSPLLTGDALFVDTLAVSRQAGMLNVMVSASGYQPTDMDTPGLVSPVLGGVTHGTVSFQEFVDPNNGPFNTTGSAQTPGLQGPFSGGFGDMRQMAINNLSSAFSITKELNIVHQGPGTTGVGAWGVIQSMLAAEPNLQADVQNALSAHGLDQTALGLPINAPTATDLLAASTIPDSGIPHDGKTSPLVHRNTDDLLIGGAGNDLQIGGQGSDLLIGGFGSDKLHTGGSEDALVARGTDLDQNGLAVRSVMMEWAARDQFTRAQDIESSMSTSDASVYAEHGGSMGWDSVFADIMGEMGMGDHMDSVHADQAAGGT